MFDFVSKHKRILQVVLFLTIIPFAFFGLESYTRSLGGAQDVASVDGAAITQREFAEELRRQPARLRPVPVDEAVHGIAVMEAAIQSAARDGDRVAVATDKLTN